MPRRLNIRPKTDLKLVAPGNYQYDYYDYYSDDDYSSAFSSYGGCYYRSFHWWLGNQQVALHFICMFQYLAHIHDIQHSSADHYQVDTKVLSAIGEKSGGYDEQACLQAFDAVTTELALFATRSSGDKRHINAC